jgi:hypothetical protein
MAEFGAFIASKDIAESLRLEMSILSPDEGRQVKLLVKDIAQRFTERYKGCIPEETIKEA